MKKSTLIKLFAPCLLLAGLAGCNPQTDTGIFTVMYYPGGYGKQWIIDYTQEMLAQERGVSKDQIILNKDFKIVAEENPAAENILKSKKNCPDVIYSNGLSANLIQSGLVESLEDVYNTEVDTSKGKQKIKDYVMDDCAQQYYLQRFYGQGQRLPYAIPFTNIPLSIAYNETILFSTPHVDTTYTVDAAKIDSQSGNWIAVPETVDELLSYFNDLEAKDSTLIKLGWSLADGSNWFESLYATWWAQAQGVDEPNLYKNEGSYYDFWKYDSAEIYKQTGIQTAFETVQKLIVADGQEGKVFKNSHPNYKTYTIKDMQREFAQGKMAMCLTGDFFEHEYEEELAQTTDVFKLMRVPSIEGAEKNLDGSVKKLTYVNTSSVLFIPSGAQHKELAKKFLVYSSQEAQILSFLKDTGGIRAFNIDKITLGTTKFTDFQQSVIDLYFDRDDLLIKFPRNVAQKSDISPIYFYETVRDTLFSVIDYASLLYAIKDYTAKQICIDSVQGNNGVYNFKSLYLRSTEAFKQWAYYFTE